MKPSKQRLKPFGCQLLLFLLVFVTTTAVHELAHAVVDWRYGVPWSQIKFGFCGINPCVTPLVPFTGHGSTVSNYVGGIAAGFLLLVAFASWLKWNWTRMSFGHWFFGALWVGLLVDQFFTGYVEGRDHIGYLMGKYQVASTRAMIVGLLKYLLVSLLVLVRRRQDKLR